MCSLHRYLQYKKETQRSALAGRSERRAKGRSNLLRCFAVRELVVGELLPVGQASVNVVEDVEVPFASVGTHRDTALIFSTV